MFLFWEVWLSMWRSGGSELEFIGPPMLLTKKHLSPKTYFAGADALWLGWKALLFAIVLVAEKEQVSRTFLVSGMWKYCWRQGSLKFAVPGGGCFLQEAPVLGSASSWRLLWAS